MIATSQPGPDPAQAFWRALHVLETAADAYDRAPSHTTKATAVAARVHFDAVRAKMPDGGS